MVKIADRDRRELAPARYRATIRGDPKSLLATDHVCPSIFYLHEGLTDQEDRKLPNINPTRIRDTRPPARREFGATSEKSPATKAKNPAELDATSRLIPFCRNKKQTSQIFRRGNSVPTISTCHFPTARLRPKQLPPTTPRTAVNGHHVVTPRPRRIAASPRVGASATEAASRRKSAGYRETAAS
ncbi:hypothetical protein GWI33_013911 [Rhynchophorus ferrugineus]|uniref:Uncharacterized protein n=1 Tax=Rhynchophorus ferrugineus TaxID=354439 RepID=A0A834M9J0_RHYFE|nr:hypothetical protein GWI33_013911 [Rhynchophorus ferrugineus]